MAAVVAFDGPAAAAGAAAAVGGAAACPAAAGAGAAGGAGLGAVAGSAADSVSPAAAPIACADASCWRANSSLAAVFAALRCCPTSTAACAFALAAATLASKAVRFSTSPSQRRDAAASSSALSESMVASVASAASAVLVGVARGYGGSAKSLNDTGADHAGGLGPR